MHPNVEIDVTCHLNLHISPLPKKPILYIVMPSTRITIVDFPTGGRASNEIHRKSSGHDESNVSPAAELLIDTIQCARTPKVNVPRAFLLTGPPGVGKTYSVRLAVEASYRQGPTQFLSLQGSELLSASNHPAEAAKSLNQHFQKIVWFCELENHVGIVFIDECEALLSSDSVAAMFGSLLDKVSCSTHNGWKQIVIVVATNSIDAVPAWLRRPGRLDREIALGPPDAATRLDILKQLLKTTAIQPSECPNQLNEEDLRSVAEACVGYVPADLAALVRRAALLAFQEDTRQVTIEFLRRAMADVGASVSDMSYYYIFCSYHNMSCAHSHEMVTL
jgi:SpoVK/Ycf46/Vps4 family AAA+-type ATPase